MKRKGLFSLFLTFILLFGSLFSFAGTASAATHQSSSGGSGGGGGSVAWAYPVRWVIKTGPFTAQSPAETFSAGSNESMAYLTARMTGSSTATPSGNPWWTTWHLGYITPTYTANWQSGYAGLASNFQSYLSSNGFSAYNLEGKGSNYVFKRGSEWLDAVAIPTVTWQNKSSEKISLVKVTTPGSGTILDRTGDSAQSLFDNPTTSKDYSYESKEKEYSYNHTIRAYQVKVTKTWKVGSDGSIKDVKYTKGATTSNSVNESWSVRRPELTYSYFNPYDLRTEKVADKSIVTSEGFNAGKSDLLMSVDNKLDKVTGENLPTLDTNDAFPFNVTFNNDQFGIPTSSPGFNIMNRDTMPPESEVGDSNQVYWGAKLSMGASSKDYSPDRSSLQFGNENETPDGSSIVKSYGFKGGDFKFRSIKTGTYYLGLPDGRPSTRFWYTTYNTGMYYRYGHKYSGRVSTGASVPNFSNRQNSDTRRYVDTITNQVTQPTLYGVFDVKTVAGDTKK